MTALDRLQQAMPPRHWLEVRSPVVDPIRDWEEGWQVSVHSYDDDTLAATRPTLEEACDAVREMLG